MPECVRALYRLPADDACPAQARAIVDRELGSRVPRPTLEELELMVSELVTGAVPAVAALPDGSILLDLRVDHLICCSVIAPGVPTSGVRPVAKVPRGWGLRLVAELADRWGVSRAAGDATRIWFEAKIPA
jgi:hypothetical protein